MVTAAYQLDGFCENRWTISILTVSRAFVIYIINYKQFVFAGETERRIDVFGNIKEMK
jgi:hypothetical protein